MIIFQHSESGKAKTMQFMAGKWLDRSQAGAFARSGHAWPLSALRQIVDAIGSGSYDIFRHWKDASPPAGRVEPTFTATWTN